MKTSLEPFIRELEAKEEQIRLLKRECDERLRLLNQAELRLEEMTGERGGRVALRSWVLAVYRTMLRKRGNHALTMLFRPKLGALKQHEPIQLVLPQHYYQTEPPESHPPISIVTPSLNQAQFLARTIGSVLNQEYSRLEYVIRDGASTDGTKELLEGFSHHALTWESAPDDGQAHAINLGFKKTTGEIMAYLNADDLLLPGCLNYVVRFFDEHPEVDVIYGHRVLIDDQDREIGRWVLPRHDSEVLRWVDYLPQETLFWRRRIWEKIGGSLDITFKYAMDWDLVLRFIKAGAKFVRVPRFLGAFRVHESQKTTAARRAWGEPEVARLRERCHGRPVTSEEALWMIRGYLLRHVVLDLIYRSGILKL
ncbi:MAG: glycosyltransferase [Desulfomonile tiedjei]|nr:glycosyltransferase [Desulfomonile tiedjei]